ncbi:Bug family tripartite tricarboxylate transporter substrate binding protein [Roseomonas xinghualingensis]|uniref:Bug family tripartite tricarboxylate transporter substrate binding protein n=1 Tax=Roseomonas xinghualingensis TaxID=2986475 RepID=UPI0021F1EF46|nr:tripartite tricarboxylate transporter substrate binding protein [Roseomonas sp. SXEYE001]MCV4208298.1 tripartite tricarboxylate transporter substrate binding protein [Roseomonas sp. SXEYE001]
MISRRLMLAAPALLAGRAALAQAYPDRPIRIIVGFTAAGATDLAIRAIAPRMSEALGQSVVIDNRPGAGGNIATELVVRAPADGHTLLLGTVGPMVINPLIYPNMGFDPMADLVPVSNLVQASTILVVPAERSWRSVADLLAEARKAPGSLNWGYSGVGTTGQLAASMLNQMARIETVGVPYRGGGPLMSDLLAGRLDFTFSTTPPAMPHVESGKIRVLAVTTAQRSRLMPDYPTVSEAGLPGFSAESYYMLLAPRGTPPEAIRILNAAVNKALTYPEVVAALNKQGLEVQPGSPEDTKAYLQAEQKRWPPIVAASGLRAD